MQASEAYAASMCVHTCCASVDFPFSHREGDEGQKVAWEIIDKRES